MADDHNGDEISLIMSAILGDMDILFIFLL